MPHDERAMHQALTTPRPPLPVLRAAVFAVVGTVLGTGAHQLLAERPVPWAQGATAAAVLFGLGLAGVRRPRRSVTVVVVSVLAQSGLHQWLTRTGHPPVSPAAHVHDIHAAWSDRLHDSLAMTAAHALVAVVAAVLLHRADTACWALARGLTAALDAVRARLRLGAMRHAGSPGLGGPVAVAPPEGDRLPAFGPLLAYELVRRGPPRARSAVVN
ncbi:hypothetical protein [Streptomyces bobili]|jgi:hypothetical protein|uniref:hypothetical protein n=1 Tax=Streptomyces bobili TaxID=67280 RepID=UPI001FC9D16C|nr:hypothetical protein [Streptomyces bobili]